MRYDLTLFPVSTDDEQLKDGSGKEVTFRETLITAITADVDENQQPLKGEDKMIRFELYMKLKRAKGSVELAPEEIVLLKRAALNFNIIVAGQVRQFLDKTDPYDDRHEYAAHPSPS